MEPAFSYHLFVHERGEGPTLAGLHNVAEAEVPDAALRPGELALLNVGLELRRRTTDCDPGGGTFSGCVARGPPGGGDPGRCPADLGGPSCNPGELFRRCNLQSVLKFEGYDYIR